MRSRTYAQVNQRNYSENAIPESTCLARYIAASARSINSSAVIPCLGNVAIPMLALTRKLNVLSRSLMLQGAFTDRIIFAATFVKKGVRFI